MNENYRRKGVKLMNRFSSGRGNEPPSMNNWREEQDSTVEVFETVSLQSAVSHVKRNENSPALLPGGFLVYVGDKSDKSLGILRAFMLKLWGYFSIMSVVKSVLAWVILWMIIRSRGETLTNYFFHPHSWGWLVNEYYLGYSPSTPLMTLCSWFVIRWLLSIIFYFVFVYLPKSGVRYNGEPDSLARMSAKTNLLRYFCRHIGLRKLQYFHLVDTLEM